MNSTPCTLWSIMWFTALPPAPPTPITLMMGPLTSLSTISNIVVVSLPVVTLQKPLKIALKPLPHPPEHGLDRPALARKLSVLHLRRQREQLLGARLDHLGEGLARHRARRALADAGHLDQVAGLGELAQRHAVARLDRLGVGRRRAQGHGDVVGNLVAGDRDYRG